MQNVTLGSWWSQSRGARRARRRLTSTTVGCTSAEPASPTCSGSSAPSSLTWRTTLRVPENLLLLTTGGEDFLGFALLIFLRPGFACSKTTMIKRLVLDSCSAILGSMLVHLTAFKACFVICAFSVNAVIAHSLGDPNADKFLQLFR